MNKPIEIIFKPGQTIDIVLDLDAENPTSRATIIYECDEQMNRIIVAQPSHRLSPGSGYRQLHISSLVQKELSTKVRLGYSCRIIRVLDDYRLYDQSKTEALVIEFEPDIIEINIRSAFRLQPNMNYEVIGKLTIGNEMYYSERHFKFNDISNKGVGLLIPKTLLKAHNPMLDIPINTVGKIGIYLKISDEREQSFTMESEVKVIRLNRNHNSLSGFAGCSFINLSINHEDILSRFIHQAQLYEIRKINRVK